jgi:signal transduction histidine kinase
MPEHPVLVNADPTRIAQVVGNLVSNALKHSGGQSVRVAIAEQPRDVVLSVADDGAGIPAEELGAIFEPFGRGRTATNRPGSGLGLFIVRQIVEAHGGDVHVHSAPGSGTRFDVRLPRASAP